MIIDYEELKRHFGGTTTAEVAANLSRSGVRYMTGKRGKPFTTETALNAAMGITPATLNDNRPQTQQREIEVL